MPRKGPLCAAMRGTHCCWPYGHPARHEKNRSAADGRHKLTVVGDGLQVVLMHRCFYVLARFLSQAVGGARKAETSAEEATRPATRHAHRASSDRGVEQTESGTSNTSPSATDERECVRVEIRLTNVLAVVPQCSDSGNLFCIETPAITIVPQACKSWLVKALEAIRSGCVPAQSAS